MKRLVLLLCFTTALLASIPTPAEQNAFSRYSTNSDIALFLNRIADSADAEVSIIGETFCREKIRMLTIAKNEQLNPLKPTLFLFGTQHGDEQSGKEALMAISRDVVLGDLHWIVNHVNLLIVPAVNIDGMHANQRNNAQDLDLNRDHVKLAAPETRALHTVFRHTLPHVTLDVHEKGPGYYKEQIGVVSNLNIASALQQSSRKHILPNISQRLAKQNITFHEYLIKQAIHYDHSTGAQYTTAKHTQIEYLYRFSTPDINDGRNSFGIFNTLSFILEGVSDNTLQTCRERTERQYLTIRYFIEYIVRDAQNIMSLVDKERENLIDNTAPVHLQMQYMRDENNPSLKIKKYIGPYKDSPLGVATRDIAKGDSVTQFDLDLNMQKNANSTETIIKNWHPIVISDLAVTPPKAYIVPKERTDIIQTLLDHHITVLCTPIDQKVQVELLKITDIIPSLVDYNAPELISVISDTVTQKLPAGTFIIPVRGIDKNLITILLEPQSQFGLIRYFKYHLTKQPGNYYDICRLNNLQNILMLEYK